MSEKFTCPICGEPTRIYMGNARKDRLCGKHADELKAGKIEQCPDCSAWINAGETCKCRTKSQKSAAPERQTQENKKCIVCGETAQNGPLCKDCYYEMLDVKDSFDKNQKSFQLTDYYFNLRTNIYRMKNFDYIQANCLKLMALAVLLKELYDNTSLTDRIVNDIKEIIEKKRPEEEKEKTSEFSKIQDSRKEEIKRTMDGHYVKSDAECIIDDILYSDLRILHCYEKKVPIDAEEQTIMADWFIPVHNSRKGIYIEYWGMNTKEYLKNKERKLTAYKDHNIPLINIEKDDYKDRQGLADRLIQEINLLAKKHFKIDNFLDI